MRVMSYVRFPVNRRVKAGITEGDRIPAPPSLTADFNSVPVPKSKTASTSALPAKHRLAYRCSLGIA